MDTPAYNERWEAKRKGYADLGVTDDGGPRGRLVVLDFRNKPFDDVTVLRAVGPYVPQGE
jgi:hypothetical protein